MGKFFVEENGILVPLPNRVTTQGLAYFWAVNALDGTQLSSWYCGLIDDTSFSAVADADVMTSHTGWTEFTGYSQATRVQWSPTASVAGIIRNVTGPMIFTMTSNADIRGLFITSGLDKAAVAGTLWCTAIGAVRRKTIGQRLKVFYQHEIRGT